MPDTIVDEELLMRAQRHAVRYLQDLSGRAVSPSLTHADLLERLGGGIPLDGEAAGAVIDVLAEAGASGTLGSAGPRFFGFVIGGSLPVALAADWLTSAWDQNAGLYVASPVASVAEEVAREWLLDLLDLPRDAGLGFVTGGQMANFTCLIAARHAVLGNAGWDVERDGLFGAPPVSLIVSEEAHVTIHTSARMLGLGVGTIRKVAADDQGRMRADALATVLASVTGPAIVCAQAGNVNSGAIDPLQEIASRVREHGAWLHIDGAFGLWGRASRDRAPLLAGAEEADSWATDAHKWLNVPYDSGLAIVRQRASQRAALTVSAAYLEQSAGVVRDSFEWVPEFSRRARGVPVYAALRSLGRHGVEELVDRCCARARQMAALLAADPRVRILNDVVLNQVLVRFGDSDALTREVVKRVQQEGTCWLSGTDWQGRAAMRISVSNWATSVDDVVRSARAILSCI